VRQRYELSKQLQDLHVDAALFSETRLKPLERFFISNYHFYRTDRYPGTKGGTAVAVRKDIPHNHVDRGLHMLNTDFGTVQFQTL
jgi:hypothetical protein